MRSHVILAVWKRNLTSYFSGVIGYLFIVAFCFAGAFEAFNPQFFANNQANLDQLSQFYPTLLLFIVPAITMTVWAEEKKLGTDELLFTLPATDFEILLGKYLSVLTVYSIALLFSLTHIGVLAYFSDPDAGLLFATMFGYFLTGASLLSAGMFASVLSRSTTVAFVLGVGICCIPVFIGLAAPHNDFIQDLSLSQQLQDFGMGIIPLSGILYFVSLTVLFLYLNLVCISKRHWSTGRQDSNLGVQYGVRTLCLALILISLNVIVGKASEVMSLRVDMTAENIYSLSDTTATLIENIDDKNPVTIEAYLSPEVPREYVASRQQLVGLLRQYDQIGGGKVTVRFVDVEPFSKQAEEAELVGIAKNPVQSERGGRFSQEDIYMGAVISSPYDEVVIPFFDLGFALEYELTRSIHTVSKQERKTIGILGTDAKLNGGFNASTFSSTPEWQIVNELKKQYKVEQVFPGSPIDASKFDVLLAVMPSSLTEPQMANLVSHVKAGHPTLIFDDPLTFYDRGQTSPSQPKPRQGGGGGMFGGGGGPPPEQKASNGQATTLLDTLGIAWKHNEVVWDTTGLKLHPVFGQMIPPEFVFISPKSGVSSAFNTKNAITKGLQEMLLFYSGTLRPRSNSDLKFEPLLRTGVGSGLLPWDRVTQPGFPFGGVQINPNPVRDLPDGDAHTIAAHITSTEEGGVNAIYVADADAISDQVFFIVQREAYDLQLDNVKFVMNAVDILAGDESYVALRSRRPTHRTLTYVEQRTSQFRDERQKADDEAKNEADEQLEKAQERLDKQVDEIRNNDALSTQEKEQRLSIAQQNEQRRLDVQKANIEREKNRKDEQNKAREQRQIREAESQIRFFAVAIPPIPAILLGFIVLLSRLNAERSNIERSRLVD